jgi:hypothetical protein
MASNSEQALVASIHRWRALTIAVAVAQVVFLFSASRTKSEQVSSGSSFWVLVARGWPCSPKKRVAPDSCFTTTRQKKEYQWGLEGSR